MSENYYTKPSQSYKYMNEENKQSHFSINQPLLNGNDTMSTTNYSNNENRLTDILKSVNEEYNYKNELLKLKQKLEERHQKIMQEKAALKMFNDFKDAWFKSMMDNTDKMDSNIYHHQPPQQQINYCKSYFQRHTQLTNNMTNVNKFSMHNNLNNISTRQTFSNGYQQSQTIPEHINSNPTFSKSTSPIQLPNLNSTSLTDSTIEENIQKYLSHIQNLQKEQEVFEHVVQTLVDYQNKTKQHYDETITTQPIPPLYVPQQINPNLIPEKYNNLYRSSRRIEDESPVQISQVDPATRFYPNKPNVDYSYHSHAFDKYTNAVDALYANSISAEPNQQRIQFQHNVTIDTEPSRNEPTNDIPNGSVQYELPPNIQKYYNNAIKSTNIVTNDHNQTEIVQNNECQHNTGCCHSKCKVYSLPQNQFHETESNLPPPPSRCHNYNSNENTEPYKNEDKPSRCTKLVEDVRECSSSILLETSESFSHKKIFDSSKKSVDVGNDDNLNNNKICTTASEKPILNDCEQVNQQDSVTCLNKFIYMNNNKENNANEMFNSNLMTSYDLNRHCNLLDQEANDDLRLRGGNAIAPPTSNRLLDSVNTKTVVAYFLSRVQQLKTQCDRYRFMKSKMKQQVNFSDDCSSVDSVEKFNGNLFSTCVGQ